jgi:hypothetical protein
MDDRVLGAPYQRACAVLGTADSEELDDISSSRNQTSEPFTYGFCFWGADRPALGDEKSKCCDPFGNSCRPGSLAGTRS